MSTDYAARDHVVTSVLGVAACKQPIALPPYSHISVSSEKKFKRGSSCMAEDGYIMTNKAWCAKQNNGRWSHTG